MKKILAVIIVVFSVVWFGGCMAQKPLRLHVIANSNTQADQLVKLKVRDAILEMTSEGMTKLQSKDEAKEYIEENLSRIEGTANDVLLKNGFDYQARAELGVSNFPDKTYGDTVYPAGEYEALKIVLGKGEGENWWCVVFPPLCLTPTNPEQPIEYKSAIWEWIENLFS